MATETRTNEDRDLAVPADLLCKDHALPVARAHFDLYMRFSADRQCRLTVVVCCPVCSFKARATTVRSRTKTDPNAYFTEKAVAGVLTQAVNNFRDKAPGSCGNHLAKVIIGS